MHFITVEKFPYYRVVGKAVYQEQIENEEEHYHKTYKCNTLVYRHVDELTAHHAHYYDLVAPAVCL